MKVRAQIGMVMNLDKCIGCHTCSVTCKQVWTNRPGAEYMWFNDVETKPGLGYPKRWQDQEQWKGGWELGRNGKLKLKAGGRLKKLLSIFSNPDMPQIDDYYEPWTYDYDQLIKAPLSEHDPVARAESQLTGRRLENGIQWGPNWDDNLAGAPERIHQDPLTAGIEDQVKATYEQAFMFYLPRICEHCLNPSCVASCPSGAMYKREEDGIVLVDQEKCRGWRFCVSGCPYKKVYFNHNTGKAEKCTLCYPRIEQGQPTICSETCVGRIRYIGLVLYDADRVEQAASTPDESGLLAAQQGVFLNPDDPEVREQAARDGIPDDWIRYARRSPVYALAHRYKVALPLHPEFRTLPMVWYVPPLSPIVNTLETDGYEADPDDVFPAIDNMRIPVDYLANLLAAGDSEVIRGVLRRLAAMRGHMRKREVLGEHDEAIAATAGMSVEEVEDMYRLLAIAKYEDRYVIPQAHRELADNLMEQQGSCGLDFEGGPGNCGAVPGKSPAGAGAGVRKAQTEIEGFMLTEEGEDDEPVRLDIIKMLGHRGDGSRGGSDGDTGGDGLADPAGAAG
ncbi:MAG: nitrate reductase subunit beta [Solirubrobacterales bacterium]|nr:nitrate reductase subunit beta [Solirubrobacterales bacterium]